MKNSRRLVGVVFAVVAMLLVLLLNDVATRKAAKRSASELPIWEQQNAAAAPVSSKAGPDGTTEWRYWPNLGGKPPGVPPNGSMISGRLTLTECWQDIGEVLVTNDDYDRISLGMTYEEVHKIVGEVTLPDYTFAPGACFEIHIQQGRTKTTFVFVGGKLSRKDRATTEK